VPVSFAAENPLFYYTALSAAMAACLYLFVTLKYDFRRFERRFAGRFDQVQDDAARLSSEALAMGASLADLTSRTAELETTMAVVASAKRDRTLATGIDANQRTQVIRMTKRGDRPEQIAAELNVPKNEVDLLLKVHRAVVRQF
jgi:hypothetical protein